MCHDIEKDENHRGQTEQDSGAQGLTVVLQVNKWRVVLKPAAKAL